MRARPSARGAAYGGSEGRGYGGRGRGATRNPENELAYALAVAGALLTLFTLIDTPASYHLELHEIHLSHPESSGTSKERFSFHGLCDEALVCLSL